MRKEILLAIGIGAILGLVVTYGIYTANKAIINKQAGLNPQTTTIPTPTPAAQEQIKLEVDEPQSGIAVDTAKITITGTTTPEAIIAIVAEGEDYLAQADQAGYFSQEITLIKGANTVTVSASDGELVSPSQTIQIVYSTELNSEEE
ncbi:hypothetical protein GYA49_02745 [Candidatus Beckwithbacteria bacterium]|nr:hypothetical protein [Candidatus Beckwithbacteria bacterium]